MNKQTSHKTMQIKSDKKSNPIVTLVGVFNDVAEQVDNLYASTDQLIGQIQNDPSSIGLHETTDDVRQGRLQSYLSLLDKAKDLLPQFSSYSRRIAEMVKQLKYKPKQLPDWLTEWVASASEARQMRLEKRKQKPTPTPYWLQKELKERERRRRQRLIEWKRQSFESTIPTEKDIPVKEKQTSRQELDEWLADALGEDLNRQITVRAIRNVVADRMFDDIVGSLYSLYDRYFSIDGPVKDAADNLLQSYGVGKGNVGSLRAWSDHINIVTELFGGIGQLGSIFDGFRDGFVRGFEIYINTANSLLSKPKVLDQLVNPEVEQEFHERQEEIEKETTQREREIRKNRRLSGEEVARLQSEIPGMFEEFMSTVESVKDDKIGQLTIEWRYLKDIVFQDLKSIGYSLDSEFAIGISVIEQGINSRLNDKRITTNELLEHIKVIEDDIEKYCNTLVKESEKLLNTKIQQSVNWNVERPNVASLLKHYLNTNRLSGDIIYYMVEASEQEWQQALKSIQQLFAEDMNRLLQDIKRTGRELETDLKAEVESLNIDMQRIIG